MYKEFSANPAGVLKPSIDPHSTVLSRAVGHGTQVRGEVPGQRALLQVSGVGSTPVSHIVKPQRPHDLSCIHQRPLRDAEFVELEAHLNAEETRVYDQAVGFWRHLKRALEDVEAIMPSAAPSAPSKRASANGGAEGGGEGADDPGKSGKDVWKSFWSTQQRFFKLLCVSMKVCGSLSSIRDMFPPFFPLIFPLIFTLISSGPHCHCRGQEGSGEWPVCGDRPPVHRGGGVGRSEPGAGGWSCWLRQPDKTDVAQVCGG